MSVAEAERYLAIAQHDYRVLGLLTRASRRAPSPEDVTDWQVALLYYMLCILIKALGCCRRIELQDHYSIKRWLNAEADLLSIAKPYRKAEEWSRDARYEGRRFGPAEMRRYLSWFDAVYAHLLALLAAEGVTSPQQIDVRSVVL